MVRTEEPSSPTRPVSRWRWLLPAAIVLVWLAFGGVAGPYAGKLSEVAENDNAAFLPATAESTEVSEIRQEFVEQETIPAIVVWEAPDGIGPDAQQAAAAQVEELSRIDGLAGPASPPIPAEDGQALSVVVPLDADLGDGLTDVITAIRDTVTGIDGAEVYVTGPAGLLGDFGEAFGAIDSILIVVALGVVLVILLVVYRSPVLPFVVLLSSVLALGAASFVVYRLADADVVTMNGQSQGIMLILVVGAATDYALLLVARYREELREEQNRFAAMRVALRQVVEPVLASGGTVILGVLCLLFSDLNSNRSLGPVAAIGIAGALVAALTFLPAVLSLLGRAAFWPFRPAYGSEHPESKGVWGRVANLVSRRPRRLWVGVVVVLAAGAVFVPAFKADGVSQSELFLNEVESVDGQEVFDSHFPGGSGTPADIVGPADQLDALIETAEGVEGVDSAIPYTGSEQAGADAGEMPGQGEPVVVDGQVIVEATLTDPPSSAAALDTVRELRTELDAVSSDVLVGGRAAQQLDTNDISARDRSVIIPIVLVVILLVLALLLRAVVAPLLLILTVVLSFATTIGVAALVFNHLFDWPGADPAVPLFAFVFLVALGIDYNIFLMTRVREESLRSGTRPGILRGLTVTGGVITSAGLVLAATFSALGVIPILFLGQIAFLVAFGVLIDTFIVRSLLVPALSYDIGRKVWWPSRVRD